MEYIEGFLVEVAGFVHKRGDTLCYQYVSFAKHKKCSVECTKAEKVFKLLISLHITTQFQFQQILSNSLKNPVPLCHFPFPAEFPLSRNMFSFML